MLEIEEKCGSFYQQCTALQRKQPQLEILSWDLRYREAKLKFYEITLWCTTLHWFCLDCSLFFVFFFSLTKCWPQLLALISCEWALTQGANMQWGTWWESCSNTKGTNMVSNLGGEDRLWISSWPLTAYQHWSLIYVNNCSWNTLFCSVLVKPCDSNMGEVGYHSPANL